MKKILIAKITTVFGVKGEVKLLIHSQKPKNIEKYQIFDKNNKNYQIKLKNSKIIGNSSGDPIVIAKIDGINDRDEAEKLRGIELFTNRDQFEALEPNQFYYSDLIGLKVKDTNHKEIATVKNIFDYGAGGVVEIEFTKDKIVENFPFKDEIFPIIDLKQGFMVIDIPDIV